LDARIVDDYEGRKPVVDSISQTIVEFKGSNGTYVQALVIATRDALRPFLAGGMDNNQTRTPAEVRLREIQISRENAGRRAVKFDDTGGLDEGDETGIYKDILHRDFSDWGKYTATGAQISAAEVQGVLLLSDVYGAFTDDTKVLAEKIAFECQPIIVMVPDLFLGDPWVGPTDKRNGKGQSYEQWRSTHPDRRVSINIRAAAACLRQRYGASSVVVWGMCYGGGRALEAASGWLPDNGSIHDIDGSIGPPLVDPIVAIAWYPTRYNKNELFGKHHRGSDKTVNGEKRRVAVMAVFAEDDTCEGATREDAVHLKALLEQDDRIIDHMVKVFPNQDHGFAHIGLSQQEDRRDPTERFVDEEFGGSGRIRIGNSEAEVACLLSTAFMETYGRVFLPTVGPPISCDEDADEWGATVDMKDLLYTRDRDIRNELNEAMASFREEPLGGYRIDPSDESQEEQLASLLRSMQDQRMKDGPYKIQPDDNLATIYAKLIASDENFQLF
jgi:dienelactone hydrolase